VLSGSIATRGTPVPPGRRRAGPGRRLLGELAERPLPALAQRRDPKGTCHIAARAVGQIEKPIDLRDGHGLGPPLDALDLVAVSDLALAQHAQVETRATVSDQERRHPRLVHAQADPITRDARLADLEQRRADAVAIADADLIVGQSLDGEVLAELPKAKVVAAEEVLPVAVGLDLVDEHGTVYAPVSLQIALAVAIDVQATHHPAPLDPLLPDARVDGPPLPLDVARQANVD
jgi:hypothetical protein